MALRELEKIVAAVEKEGILLVYPLKPPGPGLPSMWSALYPRREMRWSWDADADPRVAHVWHLREELSRSDRVVYAKWFRDRGTFFSRAVYRAFLGRMLRAELPPLAEDAAQLLAVLEESSPRSTKEVRVESGLAGKMLEGAFQRALKALFRRFLVVGYGEIADGAFPSLALGASRLLFEDLWDEARAGATQGADEALLASVLARSPALARAARLPFRG